MPKIGKPPPRGILDHLIERYRDGRISASDFVELKHWLESDPEVPEGMRYKRFNKFILVGEGAIPKTFSHTGHGSKRPRGSVRSLAARLTSASPEASFRGDRDPELQEIATEARSWNAARPADGR